MLSDGDPPTYTPLPLPDPNSSEYAKATARERVSLWWRLVKGACVLTLLGGAIGAAFAWNYWEKSQAYDLNKVAFIQKGSVVHDREGAEMGRLFALDRLPIKIDDLPAHFIDALIATEDNRFFEHVGFDWVGIGRAAIANIKAGSVREGGSTITQQLARQCYGLSGRTLDRKFTEIALSIRIEQAYSKHEIIEHYLNYIYFGSGYWGLGSAARGYFGKAVSDLTIAESALICGIIKSPSSYSPRIHPEIALIERNRSLRNMASLGLIDDASAETAIAGEIELTEIPRDERKPQFLLARIQKEVRTIARQHDFPLDGLLIESSVDSYLQRAARGYLDTGLTKVELDPDFRHPSYVELREKVAAWQGKTGAPYLQGAVVVIHNATGQILAAIGGRDFRDSEYNRAFDARRPPGTAFLPLVYAAALERDDIDLSTELTDAPMDNRQVMVGGTEGVLGEWGRENFAARYEGQISTALALFDSRNAASVEIAHKVGMPAIYDLVEQAGISSPLREYPSTFLGQSELTLAELAHAYTLFPNLGSTAPEPSMVTRIYGSDGQLLYDAPKHPQSDPVISEINAAQISGILRAGFFIGNNRSAYSELGLKDQSVAGKGGTTHGFSDGWFVGYNNVVTCAVWVGFDTPREIHSKAFSRNVALPIWVDLMNALPAAPLPKPGDSVPVEICLRTGLRATADCVEDFPDGKPYHTGVSLPFQSGTEPHAACHHQAPGSVSNFAAAPDTDDKTTGSGAPEATVISSNSPLVIGPDPFSPLRTGTALPH